MAPPFRRGDMVWSYFPFAETPDVPARTRHAAIIVGAFSAIDASKMLGHPAPAYGAAVANNSIFRIVFPSGKTGHNHGVRAAKLGAPFRSTRGASPASIVQQTRRTNGFRDRANGAPPE